MHLRQKITPMPTIIQCHKTCETSLRRRPPYFSPRQSDAQTKPTKPRPDAAGWARAQGRENVAAAPIYSVEPDRIEQQHPAPQRTVLRWVGGNGVVCGARDMCFLVENAERIFAVRVPHLQARVQLCKCSERAGRTASVPGVDGGRWGLGFVHRVVEIYYL